MRVGTDIIEIHRIKTAVDRNDKFPARILTSQELALFNQYAHARSMEFLAGRFSAKEAYAKALGTGIGSLRFTDISIMPDEKGAPHVIKGPQTEGVHVSISHSKEYATATVILEIDPD